MDPSHIFGEAVLSDPLAEQVALELDVTIQGLEAETADEPLIEKQQLEPLPPWDIGTLDEALLNDEATAHGTNSGISEAVNPDADVQAFDLEAAIEELEEESIKNKRETARENMQRFREKRKHQICPHGEEQYKCKDESCKLKLSSNKLCEHGKRKGVCVDCGGSEICEHKRLRYNCIECKGTGVCEHSKLSRFCEICKVKPRHEIVTLAAYLERMSSASAQASPGVQTEQTVPAKRARLEHGGGPRKGPRKGPPKCEHGKVKRLCKVCGGSHLCQHEMNRYFCVACKGAGICEHSKRFNACKICKNKPISDRVTLAAYLESMFSDSAQAGSGVQTEQTAPAKRARLEHSGGPQKCEHGKVKGLCKVCGGSQICQHGRRRYGCVDCKGAGVCEHSKQFHDCKICKVKPRHERVTLAAYLERMSSASAQANPGVQTEQTAPAEHGGAGGN